jgi:hypothetical protein
MSDFITTKKYKEICEEYGKKILQVEMKWKTSESNVC